MQSWVARADVSFFGDANNYINVTQRIGSHPQAPTAFDGA